MTASARLFLTHVAVLLRCVCVQVIPELNGKLTGMAFRVPTQVRAVSAVRTLGQCIFISSSCGCCGLLHGVLETRVGHL